MPRPKKMRLVCSSLQAASFVPENIRPEGTLHLTLEGMEALRLSDFEKMDREEAAQQMGISRQTFGRILAEAREVVTGALVTKQRLLIDGGHYSYSNGRKRRRRGRMQQHRPSEIQDTGSSSSAPPNGGNDPASLHGDNHDTAKKRQQGK